MNEEKLIKGLSNGVFFNPRMLGVRRMRTLVSRWLDEYTEDKQIRHLFSKAVKGITLPSPSYFALRLGSFGWWTSDGLYEVEMDGYREKLEKVRAKLLKELRDPFFLARFKEVVGAHGLSPAELLESIRIALPIRKIEIVDMNETQKEELIRLYKREIEKWVSRIISSLRILLVKGRLGRKARIESLIRDFNALNELNIGEHLKPLIDDLSKTFGAVASFRRREVPDLSKHLAGLPKSIRTPLNQLIKDLEVDEYWRTR